jgi:hypothetical protein
VRCRNGFRLRSESEEFFGTKNLIGGKRQCET